MRRLRLPDDMRSRLREPIGELIHGPPQKSVEQLRQIVKSAKPSKIISVGDFVSKLLAESSVRVDLAIIDNKVMRQEIDGSEVRARNVFRTSNAAGGIEMIAWAAVKEALKKPDSVLIVNGEEDLLTLAAIASAPRNALVVYGQPSEGMVVVRVNRAKKSEVASIISQMIQE